MNRKSGFFTAKRVTLMDLKFKTLTLKISGLCVMKRVLNHKSIPIYYVEIAAVVVAKPSAQPSVVVLNKTTASMQQT